MQPEENRFEDFFQDTQYIHLKNSLYNYRLRKHAIEKALENEKIDLIAEVGSGMSPVMTKTDRIIYSDLSFTALKTLRQIQPLGRYVVADATRLPFKDGAFSHAISSEVLEHIENDQAALRELSRITRAEGNLLITFPHRKCYTSIDDKFVGHFRRYELDEMAGNLRQECFSILSVQKVLGPLDKIAMCLAVCVFACIGKIKRKKVTVTKSDSHLFNLGIRLFKFLNSIYLALAWLDAKIMPRPLSTILLVRAHKTLS